jgi:hypothetical protein
MAPRPSFALQILITLGVLGRAAERGAWLVWCLADAWLVVGTERDLQQRWGWIYIVVFN